MQHSFENIYILLIGLIMTVSSVMAENPNVVNFYRTDYDAANKNWSIAQDRDGIMYFGNDNGLLEFDGIRWQLYRPLGNKLVRSVAVAPNGTVFTGGYEEFGYWQRGIDGKLLYLSLSENFRENFHNDEIWKIWTDDSLVFFQSFSNVYIYDGQTVRKVNPPGSILFLLKVRGEYWVQVMGGVLYRMSQEGVFDEIPGSGEFGNTDVRVILPFGEKDYLIGTSTRGVFIYDGVQYRPWNTTLSQQLISFELNNGVLGRNGHYYFGTILNGLFEVDGSGEVINHWSANNHMQNSTVLSLYEDQLSNIWVALDRGITFIRYLPGMDCHIDPWGRTGAVYSAIFHNGMFYLGTNQGVFRCPQNSMEHRNMELIDGTQGQVWDLKIVDGQLLCGHNKGLRLISKDGLFRDIENISTGVFKIQKINYIGNDYVFAGTYVNVKILKHDNGQWKTVRNADLANFREPVTNIERDHIGNIWLEHARKGVYRCVFSEDMSRLKTFRFYGSRGAGRLRLFKVGERVIFSANDSIFVYDDNSDQIRFHEGLNRFFKNIRGLKNIISASPNHFWAITTNSLHYIRFDGQNSEIDYSYYIDDNNLALVNDYENIVRLNDTLSLVCLDKGFLLHHAGGTAQQNVLRKPHLRSISAIDYAGATIHLGPSPDNYRLNFRQNTLLFDFFTADAFPMNLSFQYRLDGVDTEWSTPERIHEILFERLPPGDYTFRLRACNHLNEYSEPVLFSFSVLPPWYLTPLAYIAGVILFVAILAVAWILWLRRLRNRHLLKIRMREEQRLRRLNDELRKEIDDKNSELLGQTTFIIQKNELIAKVKHEISGFYRGLSGSRAFKPLYDKIEALLDKNMDMDEDWKMFLIRFEQTHVDFFMRIKAGYPGLTPHDLKLCACLKLNLSSKDIASLMNISLRGVENSRYRLRKKLGLSQNQNLTDFFMQY